MFHFQCTINYNNDILKQGSESTASAFLLLLLFCQLKVSNKNTSRTRRGNTPKLTAFKTGKDNISN